MHDGSAWGAVPRYRRPGGDAGRGVICRAACRGIWRTLRKQSPDLFISAHLPAFLSPDLWLSLNFPGLDFQFPFVINFSSPSLSLFLMNRDWPWWDSDRSFIQCVSRFGVLSQVLASLLLALRAHSPPSPSCPVTLGLTWVSLGSGFP